MWDWILKNKPKTIIMKGGVLIIGSLLWDAHQGKHLNARKNWRSKRLKI